MKPLRLRMVRRCALFGAAAAVALFASACGTPQYAGGLVKDVVKGKVGSVPSGFALSPDGSFAYFTTQGTSTGQLWRTNGTAAGTQLVTVLNPTGPSAMLGHATMNGVFYFGAYDGSDYGLWATDGTTAGTSEVISFSGAGLGEIAVIGSTLYFPGDDGSHGTELWKSDGTNAGTSMVKDIFAGGSSSLPSQLTVLNGVLYFTATSLSEGTELWRSDGTEPNTTIAADLNSGLSSEPMNLTMANGALYFSAFDVASGREPYVSDGTTATQLANIASTSNPSDPTGFTAFGGDVYFVANDLTKTQLWKTNGTPGGTAVAVSAALGGVPADAHLTGGGDWLYFSAVDGAGRELWRSDGTDAETAPVGDINPSGDSNPADLVTLAIDQSPGPTLFVPLFTADDGTHGRELWQIADNGGPRLVADVNPKKNLDGGIGHLVVLDTPQGPNVLFSANDGKTGAEPWLAFAPPTQLKSLKPANGCPGTVVTATGKYLTGADAPYNGVVVNSMSTSFVTVVNDGKLTFLVPFGAAATGDAEVSSPNGYAKLPFKVNAPAAKKVSAYSGNFGETLTFTGSCLADATPAINGTTMENIAHNGDTQITAQVAMGTTDGPIALTSTHGNTTLKKPFDVTGP
jgi:ELWxxDGT repeat protein